MRLDGWVINTISERLGQEYRLIPTTAGLFLRLLRSDYQSIASVLLEDFGVGGTLRHMDNGCIFASEKGSDAINSVLSCGHTLLRLFPD